MSRSTHSLEDLFRQLWLQGALDSEGNYKLVGNAIVAECRACVLRMEYDKLVKLSQALNWVEPLCREEPLISSHEWITGSVGVLVAFCPIFKRQFDEVYMLTAALLDMMEEGARRRAQLGREVQRHSQVCRTLVQLLADCKWQDDVNQRDKLVTPEWLFERYEKVYQRIVSFLAARPSSAEDVQMHRNALAMCGAAVAKMAARFLPHALTDFVQRFNRRFGAFITLGPGHFRDGRPLGGKWYWDFEIAKLYIAGDLDIADLRYCHHEREKASALEPENHLTFMYSAEREIEWMIEQAKDAKPRRRNRSSVVLS